MICRPVVSISFLNLLSSSMKHSGALMEVNCWIPAGPSGDCIPLKRIKTEPPDGEIIQVTVPGECAEKDHKHLHFYNHKQDPEMCFHTSSLTDRRSVIQFVVQPVKLWGSSADFTVFDSKTHVSPHTQDFNSRKLTSSCRRWCRRGGDSNSLMSDC